MTHRGRRSDRVTVHLRMSTDKRAKLQAIADKRGLTRAELLGIYIDIGMEADEGQINYPLVTQNGGPPAVSLLDHPGLRLGDGPQELPGLEVDDTQAQQELQNSVDRAILEVVKDAHDAELGAELDAVALAEIGIDETPVHLHGPWSQVLGSEIDVAGIRHATFMCAQCGGSKFDAVH